MNTAVKRLQICELLFELRFELVQRLRIRAPLAAFMKLYREKGKQNYEGVNTKNFLLTQGRYSEIPYLTFSGVFLFFVLLYTISHMSVTFDRSVDERYKLPSHTYVRMSTSKGIFYAMTTKPGDRPKNECNSTVAIFKLAVTIAEEGAGITNWM